MVGAKSIGFDEQETRNAANVWNVVLEVLEDACHYLFGTSTATTVPR